MKRISAIKKMKQKRKTPLELEITSLLDILVILLVFLLKSFNASDLTLDLAKNLEIPSSSSEKLGNLAPIIQVNKDKKVWIDNKEVGIINSKSETIQFLYKELKIRRNKDLESDKVSVNNTKKGDKEKKEIKKVNIVLDQALTYNTLRQVMNTSARAGYAGFKFIVKGNY